MQKLLAVIVALTMLLTLLPAGMLSVSAVTTSDGFVYTVSNGTAIITGYSGNLKAITVPATVNGYSVTAIGKKAFANHTALTSVTISSGIKTLSESVFYECTNLTRVNIPKTVTTIGDKSFLKCEKLTTITVASTNTNFSAVDGVLFNKKRTTLLQYPSGKSGITYAIPSTVTAIGDHAFAYSNNLTSMTVPSGVTSIGRYAFYYCSNLASVSIPSSVTSVGNYAFYRCSDLTSLVIPSGVTTIGTYAFCYCTGLTSITIPKSVTNIGYYAFYHCVKLRSVSLPSSLAVIQQDTFSGCTGLTSVVLPKSVTSIGKNAFADCTALRNVWYVGTSKSKISFQDGNNDLKNATWAYKVLIKNGHVYYNACDATCNVCDAVRTPSAHKYTDCTDSTCNVCNASRVAGKCQWDGCKDTKCNVCGKVRTALKHKYADERDLTCDKCGRSRKAITTLKIDGVVIPLLGETVKNFRERTTLSCNNGITGYGVEVFDDKGNLLKDTTTFKANSSYLVCFYFKADDYDVILSTECVVSVNKGSVTSFRNSNVDGEWWTDIFVNFKIGQPISVTTQPKNTQVKNGATAKATVKATGEGLKYQWYVKNAGSSKYSKSSITSATYSTKMATASRNRYVYCIVTDKYGNRVKTNTVVLRMAASITKESATVAYAKKGAKASVKVTAKGDGLKYTWYIKNNGASKYSKSSVTSATYSAVMGSKVKGRLVYCIVRDKYGNEVRSKTFLLREGVSITTQPKTVTVAKNKTAKVTVKASGDGLKYTWYIKNVGSSKYIKSSVKSASYSAKMTNAVKNRLAYCLVTDKYGNTVKTVTVKLKMK